MCGYSHLVAYLFIDYFRLYTVYQLLMISIHKGLSELGFNCQASAVMPYENTATATHAEDRKHERTNERTNDRIKRKRRTTCEQNNIDGIMCALHIGPKRFILMN